MENLTVKPRVIELPRPESVPCPYNESYTTDVLVIGCGFAGLNAAVSAKLGGAEVLVMDKGRPGYSGLSPWPSSFRWFDPERGDREEAYMAAIREGGDYVSNLAWYKCWIDESKGIFERLTDWGILTQYPKASEAGDFFEKEDFWGYRATYDRLDRHKKWIATLERYEIPFLEHTMAADLLTKDGAVCGAVALHVPSGATITVRAKAVLLATGGGSYKPTGYPVGTDTFDGEYMAWKLGLPIAGKEYEDFHSTSNNAPGNVFYDNHWQYLENIWLCGGDVSEKNASEYASNKGNIMALGRVRGAVYGVAKSDGSEIQDVATANYTRRGGSQVYESDPEELRSGKMSTPVGRSDLAGAATGMCCHLTSGVFCGFEVRNDVPGMPGLFVAGDGTHCTAPSGAAYPCGVGFTSCFCSIDGDHAGKAAAAWVRGKELASADEEQIEAKLAEISAPLQREKGFDPNWARDVLHSIMAPYWVSVAKTEPTLRAALTQVEYMRDNVVPKLAAASSHDLRLCIEVRHKVLSAELKLRASLFRAESRGTHYRADIPYRKDEEYLCTVTLQKTESGIELEKHPVPDEWTGESSAAYTDRYHYYFPGEGEAKGFTPPKTNWGGKRG